MAAFTLAEVLAAITIVAIVLPVAMQGISIATGLASVTRQRAEAVALAQSKLNELVISGQWDTAAISGDFAPDHPDYRWEALAGDWEEANMRQLQVTVSWTSRGSQRQVVLATLIYANPGATQ
jgi:type II secretory pathway pseudopilin PulG